MSLNILQITGNMEYKKTLSKDCKESGLRLKEEHGNLDYPIELNTGQKKMKNALENIGNGVKGMSFVRDSLLENGTPSKEEPIFLNCLKGKELEKKQSYLSQVWMERNSMLITGEGINYGSKIKNSFLYIDERWKKSLEETFNHMKECIIRTASKTTTDLKISFSLIPRNATLILTQTGLKKQSLSLNTNNYGVNM